jgi:hypothetical protein
MCGLHSRAASNQERPLFKTKICWFFYGDIENEQKKYWEFKPQISSNFPAHDLNFYGIRG